MEWDPFEVRSLGYGNSRLGRLVRWSRSLDSVSVILRSPRGLTTEEAILAFFPEQSIESTRKFRLELLNNSHFFEELNRPYVEIRQRRFNCEQWYEFLYLVVRFARPEITFETGVFDGLSSAVILQALLDNNNGILVSMDLPPRETIYHSTHRMAETTLPPQTQPGWVVPSYLRERYKLVLGDSKELLPQLFHEYPRIDLFLHDSLHTFEHQYLEYKLAWDHLSDSGLLLSDDVFWSSAFHKFCKETKRRYVHLEGFGAVRKQAGMQQRRWGSSHETRGATP